MRFDSRGLVSTYISQWMPLGDVTRQPVAGYFAGGTGASYLNSINKFTFSTEAISTPSAVLSGNIVSNTGFANSGVAGYSLGGFDDSTYTALTTIDKIAFPADTKSSSTVLTTAKDLHAGFSNTGVAGYVGGGRNSAGAKTNNVEKLTYPSETSSAVSATLTSATMQMTAFSNYGVAGYFVGGNDAAGKVTSVDKFAFPSDTKTNLATATLGFNRTALADQGVSGYVMGGEDSVGAVVSLCEKFAFSTDTKTTTTSLAVVSSQGFGASSSGVAGYYAGGVLSTEYNTIYKFTFPSDTRSLLSAVLTSAKRLGASFSNEGLF